MSTTTARADVTQYTVTSLPMDSPDYRTWSLAVEWSGRGWAVRHLRRCYNADGKPTWEPIPSERTDGFYRRYRFTTAEEAIAVAERVLPALVVNGQSVDDIAARGRWWE